MSENNNKVALFIDKESATRPEVIGLQGENLEAQQWLEIFTDALEARKILQKRKTIKEIWVLSGTGMEAINVAAALKKDHRQTPVILVASSETGSLKSRAKAAMLDMVLTNSQFIERYGNYKRRFFQCESENPNTIVKNVAKTTIANSSIERVPPAPSKKLAFVLPIVSASGGSGKSTLAVSIAYLARRRGYNTLLFDADLQFGDVDFLAGNKKPITLDELLANPLVLSKSKKDTAAPAVLAAPSKLEQSEVVGPQITTLVDYCSEYFDLIVINTGSFWTEHHVALLERASMALFLLDQRPSAMRDCKHALEFCSRCAIATQPFHFVLNRCSRNTLFSSIDISCGLQGAPVTELQEGGKEVSELLGAGQPLDLVESKNPFVASVGQLLDEVLPQKEEVLSDDEKKLRNSKRMSFFRKRGVACL